MQFFRFTCIISYPKNYLDLFHQAVLETVARVKPKKNETKEDKYVFYPVDEP